MNILYRFKRQIKQGETQGPGEIRNAYAQTSVCPYSLRPIESCGVATPIDWDELSKIDQPDKYTLSNIFRRLSQKD
jgi:bifunctional non-homologous end joining protein LigD